MSTLVSLNVNIMTWTATKGGWMHTYMYSQRAHELIEKGYLESNVCFSIKINESKVNVKYWLVCVTMGVILYVCMCIDKTALALCVYCDKEQRTRDTVTHQPYYPVFNAE